MSPAQVPITGPPSATKARRGSSSPRRSARCPMVVLSPPGMTRPSMPSRCGSCGVAVWGRVRLRPSGYAGPGCGISRWCQGGTTPDGSREPCTQAGRA
eukprot:scaffold32301_cov135-Isochrysis_galbana.AAC.14